MSNQEIMAVSETGLAPVSLPPDQHPVAVYLARLGPGSRPTMKSCLDIITDLVADGRMDVETFPWHQLRYQHTAAIRAALADRYAPATANKHLAALRATLKEAWRLGLMTSEDYQRAVDLESVKGETLPAGREVSAAELRAIFSACENDLCPSGSRDAALLSLLYGAGLRRSEAVALDIADYDPESGSLTIRRGKGNKDRIVYATNGAKTALDAWLQARGDKPGALLCPVNRGGNVQYRQMTDQACLYRLRRRAEQAGVSRFSPHDLRRSYISHLLDNGADLATVQRLAGHSSPTTTARYDRRGEETKKKASELLHVPYAGPAAKREPKRKSKTLRNLGDQ